METRRMEQFRLMAQKNVKDAKPKTPVSSAKSGNSGKSVRFQDVENVMPGLQQASSKSKDLLESFRRNQASPQASTSSSMKKPGTPMNLVQSTSTVRCLLCNRNFSSTSDLRHHERSDHYQDCTIHKLRSGRF